MMNTKQVAARLGVAEATIRSWRHRGRGPVARQTSPNGDWHYREEDVESWALKNQPKFIPKH